MANHFVWYLGNKPKVVISSNHSIDEFVMWGKSTILWAGNIAIYKYMYQGNHVDEKIICTIHVYIYKHFTCMYAHVNHLFV